MGVAGKHQVVQNRYMVVAAMGCEPVGDHYAFMVRDWPTFHPRLCSVSRRETKGCLPLSAAEHSERDWKACALEESEAHLLLYFEPSLLRLFPIQFPELIKDIPTLHSISTTAHRRLRLRP